jgi:hypothetical protein
MAFLAGLKSVKLKTTAATTAASESLPTSNERVDAVARERELNKSFATWIWSSGEKVNKPPAM